MCSASLIAVATCSTVVFSRIRTSCSAPSTFSEPTPDACVLIGDSTTDILAARAAGTAVIAYANKHHKRDSFAAYRPDAIIDSITDLTEALATDNVTPSGTPATD